MKKTFIIIFILITLLSFSSCTEKETDRIIKIGTLAGPTGMGMVGFMDGNTDKYEINIYTSPDQIVPKIINGELDICAVPSNLAAVLYAKTGGTIEVLSINTTGVLYIVENGNSINSIADLAGKTIHASGQGSSPEYILNNILEQNGIIPNEDIEIIYHSEHSDLANLIASGEIDIAVLPEPFVSVVIASNPNINVQLDFSELWHDIYGQDSNIPMGVAIVQKSFLDQYPNTVAHFMDDYRESIEFVISDIDAASVLIEENKILASAAIAKNAIPRCGISFIIGDELYTSLNNYFEVLYEYNPESVGGALPNEDFYYGKN